MSKPISDQQTEPMITVISKGSSRSTKVYDSAGKEIRFRRLELLVDYQTGALELNITILGAHLNLHLPVKHDDQPI